VSIHVPSLRERPEDIHLLFRKFATDIADQYRMPAISLKPDAQQLLSTYTWPGNVRQLKNVSDQISVVEQTREIDAATLRNYLPDGGTATVLPAVAGGLSERDLFLKLFLEMKHELDRLKEDVHALRGGQPLSVPMPPPAYRNEMLIPPPSPPAGTVSIQMPSTEGVPQDVEHTEVEESLSLVDKEKELIQKALVKHRNRRKSAARELGISERTLYRKIKEYDIQ
jgi:DNA-binding NtrC family response regulator